MICSTNYLSRESKYKYGSSSLEHLSRLCPQLKDIANALIHFIDVSITYSTRTLDEHEILRAAGKTKVEYHTSLHSYFPSRAAHFEPWPIDYSRSHKNLARYYYMAGIVHTLVEQMGYKIRWGGDWDRDHDFMDQKFDDLAHFEYRGAL